MTIPAISSITKIVLIKKIIHMTAQTLGSIVGLGMTFITINIIMMTPKREETVIKRCRSPSVHGVAGQTVFRKSKRLMRRICCTVIIR